MSARINVVLIVLLLSVVLAEYIEVAVNTSLGKLRGKSIKSHDGHDILTFLGIPYAKPPIGERRFRPPEPITEFPNGVLDATKDGKLCPQIHLFGHKFEHQDMHEDCLVLNVFTKKLTKKAPVMFFMHGGAYVVGGSHSEYLYGPKYLMDEDIVLVTINYRLGALGFLSTGTKEAPGNYAFKDQVLALKWVRDHIEAFGGDPNAITIFGESAGSWSVSAMMASPMAKGLFHKAIAMSGSVTSHFERDNKYWTHKLANDTGCGTSTDEAKIVECLRLVPWETFLEVYKNWSEFGYLHVRWFYEIEKDFGQERFLVEHPTETFVRGDFHKVPLITGLTKGELGDLALSLLSNESVIDSLNNDFENIAPIIFFYNADGERAPFIAKSIKDYYFGDKKISKRTAKIVGHAVSDSLISHSTHRLVELVRKFQDVYFYSFDYNGKYHLFTQTETIKHYDEMQYLFEPNTIGKEFSKNDEDDKMMRKFIKLWTQFSQTGNPNGPEEHLKWLPSNSTYIKVFTIDQTTCMIDEPNQERYTFWDALFPIIKQ